MVADLAADPAGQAGQFPRQGRPPPANQQHEKNPAHQACAAQSASAALASSSARASASQAAIACAERPREAADRRHAPGEIAGGERRAGVLQHTRGRIADQHMIALADGHEILRLCPHAGEQRLAVSRRMSGGQRIARCFGEREPQAGLVRWRGVGEAGQRRRRSLDIAEFAAGTQRELRRLDPGNAGGMVGQALPPGGRPRSIAARRVSSASSRRAVSDCSPCNAVPRESARADSASIRPANWLSADCLASIAARRASRGATSGDLRCSSAATRAASGARSGAWPGGAGLAAAGRCSSAATRAVSGPRSVAGGAGRCSSRPTRASKRGELLGLGHRYRIGRRLIGADAARPRQRGREHQETGRRYPGPHGRCRAGSARRRLTVAGFVRFGWRQGGRFGHRSSASMASWVGRAATRMRRHGSACNATAAGWPIASASTVRTAS